MRFFTLHFVVLVDVTVLAHSIGVQFLVWALPWFFGASVLVVTVVAHALGVVLLIIVPAVNILFFAAFI